MTTCLDISIGPVQGFVAQSRRTRDLWGSSYLLSFLSGHAMRGAAKAGGRIVQPRVDGDPLYRWIGGDRAGEAPRIGSLPNRFAVEAEGDARAVAAAAVEALEAAWRRLCEAVWARFLAHAAAGDGTEAIWKRQTGAFWEVSWTTGGAAALVRRKHWRSHRPPDEHGDKCTVMHDLQELSGYVHARGSGDGRRQEEFWCRVRQRLGPLDLRQDERLCAVAFVKRLFPNPKVAPEALGWDVDSSHWPSTVYVGALPWMRRVMTAQPGPARRYAGEVRAGAGGVLAERAAPFAGPDAPAAGDFPKLDANYFHRRFVANERLCPLAGSAGSGAREQLDRLLKDIYEAGDGAGRRIGAPPSFYALLLADGDRLGRLAGELGRDPVGRALAAFTGEAPRIVREHDGVTVYAGGDDVLAMLPVPKALSCAASLAGRYRSAFNRESGATLSAAVAFAHVRLPLGAALAEAHRLLAEVAKEANGRDSLAAGVLKPGGLHCQWATTWTRRGPDGGSPSAVELLARLTARLAEGAAEPGLSSALLYRLRETLAALCGWDAWRPGAWGPLPEGLDMRAFLRAEIHHSLAARKGDGEEARAAALADLVWSAMGRSRAPGEAGAAGTGSAEAGVDALLLARFLADSERDGPQRDGPRHDGDER